uniref:Uncharacterized protein n=1 Tax=Mimivirus LCMiAC01 TaxID=2506608 RepID=A0A481Z1X8_9VIRU|nr:MAG: hypothetical protein LCMiAC01_03840 [Mimivirus LCMiAC01]
MGYTTDFKGCFFLNKPLDVSTEVLIDGLNRTRRMKRDCTKLGMTKKEADVYGIEGEFYINGGGSCGQNKDASILEYNCPPKTQAGLWCHWCYNKKNHCIEWDGGEKFYNYFDWIKYLVNKIFKPRGYILNGTVEWKGEDSDTDKGTITIKNNKVSISNENYGGKMDYLLSLKIRHHIKTGTPFTFN